MTCSVPEYKTGAVNEVEEDYSPKRPQLMDEASTVIDMCKPSPEHPQAAASPCIVGPCEPTPNDVAQGHSIQSTPSAMFEGDGTRLHLSPRTPRRHRRDVAHGNNNQSTPSAKRGNLSAGPHRSPHKSTPRHPRKRHSYLREFCGTSTFKNITPVKKRLIAHAQSQDVTIKRLKKAVTRLKGQLQNECRLSNLSKAGKALVGKLAKFMSLPAATLMAAQVRCSKQRPKGRRWTYEEKVLATSIYKRDAKAYAYLRSFMALPSVRTLTRVINAVPFLPGKKHH